MPTETKRHPDLDSLYCVNPDGSRNVIHPADVKGRYQRRKKLIWAILIAFYLIMPWVKVGGFPAILIEIPTRSFYLFGKTFNAQDFYLAFFWVSGVGFSLIVLSALFGRIWCGYGCPQTVFLDGVFRRIERFIEGNATQRKKLEQAGWTLNKVVKRGAKWGVFLLLSALLSHTFLSYFMGAEVVLDAVTSSPAEHPTAFTFILVFTGIIYLNFAWFREQLCIVICPYGRLQGVLYDPDTVNVIYDGPRGEPRGRYTESDRGDCIDCQRCIAVCPTGIDIRNGTQLECIGCANCVDACDEVMQKVGQQPGLVRYDSQRGVEEGRRRFWRPRVFLYGALMLIGSVAFTLAMSTRTAFDAMLVRERGAPFQMAGEKVRNLYQVQLANKQPVALTFELDPVEAEGMSFVIPIPEVELQPLESRRVPVIVEVERSVWHPGLLFEMQVRAQGTELVRDLDIKIIGPGQ